MIHTDEDDEFDRIAHEAKLKGQPYYFEEHPTDPEKVIFRKPSRDFTWEADAIKAAVLIEREACARIADGQLRNTNSLLTAPLQSSAAYQIGVLIRARGQA